MSAISNGRDHLHRLYANEDKRKRIIPAINHFQERRRNFDDVASIVSQDAQNMYFDSSKGKFIQGFERSSLIAL